jgi:PAS domain S-box-containing protein
VVHFLPPLFDALISGAAILSIVPVPRRGSSMTRAGAGEARTSNLGTNLSTRHFLEIAIIAVSYFGLTEVWLSLPAINTIATPLCPPTGVALSLVMLRGNRIWPAITVGSFSAGAISADQMIWETASAAIATTLAALVGAWLINRWSDGCKTFASIPSILKFVFISFIPVAVISSGIAAGAPALANAFGFTHSLVASIATWVTWWLVDAVAIVLITPVVLLWATTPLSRSSKSSLVEAVAILFIAVAIGDLSYSPSDYLDSLFPYRAALGVFILLPLMWAGLRGDQRNVATAALIFCACLIWGFLAGTGPLPSGELNRSPFFLLPLLIGTSVTSLIVAATIGTHRDSEARLIAAQLLLKLQFEQTKAAFRNAKRQLQIFIEGVADYAILMLDPSGRITSWNSTAQDVIGYEAEDIVGKHFGILYRPDERRAGYPNRALELTAQKGKYEVEGWRVRKDGTPFYVTGAFTAIHNDNGELIGFANIIRDATERREAQEKLFEAREQLAMAQKMEAIGKLTGGIAHDFNNLLMIIGGNAETFRRLLDPKLPRAIEAIEIAAKRGESLTRQLLTFSRRQHLRPTVVDLHDSIRDMRTLIESSLRGNIVYTEKIALDIWPVKVDVAELELAIVNIAVNARDAMPNGGAFTLTAENVEVGNEESREHQKQFVELGFSDTGVGIPRNLLSKIFDPFFTTKEIGKGTGLGLSQVYGFAHQAGGWVQADSKVGRGMKVTVYLPHYPNQDSVEAKAAATEVRKPERPIVLVVDDSMDVAEVTSALFERLGYDTVYRESAEAALRLLAEGANVDLVFSDIVMPGTIDGVGLASEIRSLYPNLPVILTTGYSDAVQAAAPDLRILRKPFDTAALKSFLEETIDPGEVGGGSKDAVSPAH